MQTNTEELTEDQAIELTKYSQRRKILVNRYVDEYVNCTSGGSNCDMQQVSSLMRQISSYDQRYIPDECELSPELEKCRHYLYVQSSQESRLEFEQLDNKILESGIELENPIALQVQQLDPEPILPIDEGEECSQSACLCDQITIESGDICQIPRVRFINNTYEIRICSQGQGTDNNCQYFDTQQYNTTSLLRNLLLENPEIIPLDSVQAQDILWELDIENPQEVIDKIRDGTFAQEYGENALDMLLGPLLDLPVDQKIDVIFSLDPGLTPNQTEAEKIRYSLQNGFDIQYKELEPAGDGIDTEALTSGVSLFANGLWNAPFLPGRLLSAIEISQISGQNRGELAFTAVSHYIGLTDVVSSSNRLFYQIGMSPEEAEYYRNNTMARLGDAINVGMAAVGTGDIVASAGSQGLLHTVVQGGLGEQGIGSAFGRLLNNSLTQRLSRFDPLEYVTFLRREGDNVSIFAADNLLDPGINTMVRNADEAIAPALLGENSEKFVQYIQSQQAARGTFISGVMEGRYHNFDEYVEWMNDIHVQGSAYRSNANPGQIRNGNKFLTNQYADEAAQISQIDRTIREELGTLNLEDAYDINGNVQQIRLENIPEGIRPINVGEVHYYPPGDSLEAYYREMHRTFNEFIQLPPETSQEVVLDSIAQYYQYAINARPYDKVNQ